MDGLGNPLAFLLISGNDHDSVHAIPLLKKLEIAGSNILGDKAYGAKIIRDYISSQNATYTIPPRENCHKPWHVDWHTYKERHLVECFFRSSNGSDVFALVMIRPICLSLPSFMLLLLLFC